jgi:hypothetical protein
MGYELHALKESFLDDDGAPLLAHGTYASRRARGPKSNTVQLRRMDGDVGWMLGLRPVSMRGAFDVPFGHFAFGHPRCGSLSAGRVEAVEQSA